MKKRAPATANQIASAASFTHGDVQRLARRLYAIKARAYRDTLAELAAKHGQPRQRVILSEQLRQAIRSEADNHARLSIATFNRMVSDFAAARRDHPPELLARELAGYMRQRGRTRARVVSQMAPLTARLDATIAFYRENGIEPDFDFVGPRPKCELCRRLKASGPYSVDQVLAIGYPHLGCTHTWQARTRAKARLLEGGLRPGQVSAGRGGPAGILNSQALLNRIGGSHDAALNQIDIIARAGD